jgi:hypothetical protein
VRRSSLIVSTLILASILAGAQEKSGPQTQGNPKPHILTWNPPEHPVPPMGSQLRKMVQVIQLSCKDPDGKLWSSSGTGFIVGYHDPRLSKDQNFDYLATNRHVAECWDENNRPREVQSVSMQGQMNNGRSFPLNQHGNVSWQFPADSSVDLAVTPVTFPPDIEAIFVPLDSFFAKEDFVADNVGEGAKIILSGYSYRLAGEPRPQPLIREGILSMIADVPLETTTHKKGTVYLGDVHIFGGNSGSPVFISMAGIRPSGIVLDDNYRFLGVASGYYYEDSEFNLEIATTVKGTQRANSGISMIVPADFLKDLILNDATLKGARDSYFAVATGTK